MTTDHTELDATIAALGLEYTAAFVPQSQSRHASDKEPSLNWRVTIKRGRQMLTTDYMQGIGHLPKDSKSGFLSDTQGHAQYERQCAESGVYQHSPRAGSRKSRIPAPALRDVLYCLVLDAGVINYATFEDWAGDFGYDTDSRKAEATYRACLEITLQLRAMVGNDGLTKLQDAFQDY